MKITEIHARGLTTTFFNQMAALILSDTLIELNERQKFKSTRASWDRFVLALKLSLRNCTLASYEGGSKRQPYFSACGLHINKKREINSWQERCLSGDNIFVNFDRACGADEAQFNIGEHAIARLFERAKIALINDSGDIDVFRILPVLQSIPLWSAFWANAAMFLREFYKIPIPLRPIIPTPFGVFLGEIGNYGKALPMIEIRTFVENDSLSFIQNKVREVMWQAGKDFQNSPFAMFPLLQVRRLDHPKYIESLMCRKILPDISMLGDVVFHHVDDDTMRYQCKDLLRSYVKNGIGLSTLVDRDEKLSMFDKHGIRGVQNIMSPILFKQISTP